MIESEKQYAEAKKSGKRFIDQVRTDPPADADFVQRKYLDISYAEGSEKRKLDIYLPNEGAAPYPLIIDIYGGGWYFGKRSSYKMNLALQLLKRGYAVASIDYSLSKEAKYPTQIYEVKAAVRYLRNHADEYRLDQKRFAFLGESAGSHLGAVSALSNGAHIFEDIPFGEEGDASVQCMIALYCPTDLAVTKSQFAVLNLETWIGEGGEIDSPEGVLLGFKPADAPALTHLANPETFVTANAPAFQFFHGSDDRVVPYLQSMNLAVKLTEKIGANRVEHHLIEGAGHNQTHFMKEEYYNLMDSFLGKNMR
jgi:acetyl esterase/lipase